MAGPVGRTWKSARTLVEEDIWDVRIQDLPRTRAFLYRTLRVSVMVAKGFKGNRCRLHASALTYTMLVSLVPFLAFAFSVAKSLGLQTWLLSPGGPIERLAVGQDVARQLVEYVNRTDVRTLGALGLLVLLWTVIQLLSTIEGTMNEIWGVKQQRTLWRKFSDYLSVTVVCPVLAALALMMTAALASSTVVGWMRDLPGLGEALAVGFRLLPFAFLWIAFTCFYLFMPNTKVPFRSALGGGIAAGTCWQIGQWVYVYGNVRLARFSAIYSSFASFPMFLVWLYLSWLIALFGAEVAFALQHERTYQREGKALSVSGSERERLGLKMAVAVGERFLKGLEPWNVNELAEALDLPVRLVNDLGSELEAGGILKSIPGPVLSFHPARDLGTIPVKKVLDAVRRYGVSEKGTPGPVDALMAEVDGALSGKLEGRTLRDLASA